MKVGNICFAFTVLLCVCILFFFFFSLHNTCRWYNTLYAVVKYNDEQSEGLSRRLIIKLVKTSGGKDISMKQAEWAWDQTIFPYGKKLGLLTGYVSSQCGSSKRTAAGKEVLQRKWHRDVSSMFKSIEDRAVEVLQDEDLVREMMPALVANSDEENVQATGKNSKVAGSKDLKKHNNQNGASRLVTIVTYFFFGRVRANKKNTPIGFFLKWHTRWVLYVVGENLKLIIQFCIIINTHGRWFCCAGTVSLRFARVLHLACLDLL